METLALSLELVLEVRFGLEKGDSLKKTLQNYAQSRDGDLKREVVQHWLQILETGRSTEPLLRKRTFSERRVFEVLEQGLKGESIYAQICGLEEELFEASKLEVEAFISTLPVKALIPLLFFQFPAFLLLLFGPFLHQFMTLS